MDLLKEIFTNEVFPAIGCTEPISCAYTTAAAVEQLQAPPESIDLIVDPGTFKNGAAVTVPNSGRGKGQCYCRCPRCSHSQVRHEAGDPEGGHP